MKKSDRRPLVIGHRGASAYAPENTLAAFELAARQGADLVELDVQLTHDGHLVVMHDPTVDRTTSGRGQVGDLKLSEIVELDAGSWFGEGFSGNVSPRWTTYSRGCRESSALPSS